MSYYTDVIQAVSAATRTSSSNSNGFDVGEYSSITGYIRVIGKAGGAAASLRPFVQVSPNGSIGTAGAWVTIKSIATFVNATGIKIATGLVVAKWMRWGWTITGGATTAYQFQGWFVAQGR